MSKVARRMKLEQNATYPKKYAALPESTPIPVVEIPEGKWDLWEWWAGTCRLTKACIKKGLVCGPPLTRERGWELTNKTHQQFIRMLFDKHAPEVLFGAPTCGPWSRSNTTMDSEIKRLLREEQVEAFDFFLEHVRKQTRAKRKHLMENPRSSELLNVDECYELVEKHGAKDEVTCMCAHNLKDPDTGAPCMKQSTLRGTVKLKKSVRWCTCKVPHQILQGYTKSGILRTEAASPYTHVFCDRLADDIYRDIKGNSSAFPITDPPDDAEEEEVAADDPYLDVSRKADIQEEKNKRARSNRTPPVPQQFMQPTAKISAKPKTPTHVDAEARAAASLSQALADQPDQPVENAITELDDLPVAPDAQPLPLAIKKPAYDNPPLNEIASREIQLPSGGQRTFQTGPKVKLLQEIYGTPTNINICLVILTRKPAMIPVPEPLVSRALLSHFLHLTQDSNNGTWNNHGWREIGELLSSLRGLPRKPFWSITMFAMEKTDGDLA